jgi:1,4-alpha-glucan branching enzyme
VSLAPGFPAPDNNLRRVLNQAARELMLAQSSDWAFIMKTGSMVSYAMQRTKNHLHNFTALYEQAKQNNINFDQLYQLENQHNIFPDIDYQVFK